MDSEMRYTLNVILWSEPIEESLATTKHQNTKINLIGANAIHYFK